MAAARLTGERGAIDKAVLAAMRDTGLAHLLAISGLHIGLVAGILFFVCRAVLALWEPVALRYPIKKWAAVVALAGTAFYLLLSGATIPTQRAFLMGGQPGDWRHSARPHGHFHALGGLGGGRGVWSSRKACSAPVFRCPFIGVRQLLQIGLRRCFFVIDRVNVFMFINSDH